MVQKRNMFHERLQQIFNVQSVHQWLHDLSLAVQEAEQPIHYFWKLMDRHILEDVKSQSNIFFSAV